MARKLPLILWRGCCCKGKHNKKGRYQRPFCFSCILSRISDVPVVDLHGAVFSEVYLHLEDPVKELRLVAGLAGKAILLGHVEILLKNRLVIRVGALVDDELGTGFRVEATEVCQPLIGNQYVQVMLGVVHVRYVRHDAGDAGRVGFSRTGRRGVHDGEISIAEEVSGTADAVDHPGPANEC